MKTKILILILCLGTFLRALSQERESVEFEFFAYEMPYKTLEALTKYIDKGGAEAATAFSKLQRMSGVRLTTSASKKVTSGEVNKIEGKGIVCEMDMVAMPGQIDLNLSTEVGGPNGNKLSAIEQLIFSSNQPEILNGWILDETAHVLFATTKTSSKRADPITNRFTRFNVVILDMGAPQNALQTASQNDLDGMRKLGKTRIHQIVPGNSGNRLRSEIGGNRIELEPIISAKYNQIDLIIKVDLDGQSIGMGRKTFTSNTTTVIQINDQGTVPTQFVALITPHASSSLPAKSPQIPANAKGSGDLITEPYDVTPGFLRDLWVKQGNSLDGNFQAKDVLAGAMIKFPDSAMAVFNPRSCQIIMKNDLEGHQALKALMKGQ